MSAQSRSPKILKLGEQLDIAFNKPSASSLRNLRASQKVENKYEKQTWNNKQLHNRNVFVTGTAQKMHTGTNLLAKDRRVAIAIEGEKNGLVHFDIGQAFAWEYLRKKQKITREDLAFAEKIQKEEEQRLLKEQMARRNYEQKKILGDSDFARKLVENDQQQNQHNKFHQSDIDFALALQQQENANSSTTTATPSDDLQFLRDQEIARRLAEGLDITDLVNTPIPTTTTTPTIPTTTTTTTATTTTASNANRDALTDSQVSKLLETGIFNSPTLARKEVNIQQQLVSGKSLGDIRRNQSKKKKLWGMVENFRCFSSQSFTGFNQIAPNGNKIALPKDVLEKLEISSKEQILLEIINSKDDSRQIYVGVFEFSSPTGIAILPKHLMNQILLDEGDVGQFTRIQMPKAKLVEFTANSNQFFSDIKNFDRVVSNLVLAQRSCVSVGDTIQIANYELVVSKVLPESPSEICSDVKDLQFAFIQNSTSTSTSAVQSNVSLSSSIGNSEYIHISKLNTPYKASVLANHYSYFAFETNNASSFDIQIDAEAISGDPDLYVSQSNKLPTSFDYQWSSTSTGGDQVIIEHDDEKKIKNSKMFYIAVRAFEVNTSFQIAVSLVPVSQRTSKESVFSSLRKSQQLSVNNNSNQSSSSSSVIDSIQCWNCQQYVPERNWLRHEAFCLRNNYFCTKCSTLLQMKDKQNHWHCPQKGCGVAADPKIHLHCGKCGIATTKQEIVKHVKIAHSEIKCECGQFTGELEAVLLHRQFQCEKRKSNCEFCSGEFPEKQLSKHKSECVMQPFVCVDCSAKMKLKDAQSHQCSSGSSTVPSSSPAPTTPTPTPAPINNNWRKLSLYLCPYCNATDLSGMNGLQSHIQNCKEAQKFQ